MKTSVEVSVIIPNYNHSKYLPKRLNSIYNQTFQNFEVILLDDCSTDDSISILDNYAGHDKTSHNIYNRTNSGSTFKQWAKGIALAKGEYIWIAESDDSAELTFLEELLPLLRKQQDIGIAYCNSQAIDENGTVNYTLTNELMLNTEKGWYYSNGLEFLKRFTITNNMIPNVSACIIKKKALLKINLANNPLKLWGDKYTYALILEKYNLIYLNRPLNYFRFHANNVRSNNSEKGYLWIEALKMSELIKKESSLPENLITKSVITPLVHCIDLFVKRKNKRINFLFLIKNCFVFKQNPLRLLYWYLFKFK